MVRKRMKVIMIMELKRGIHKEWYKNGQIKEESNYDYGVLKGTSIRWYENGQKKDERNFESANNVTIRYKTEVSGFYVAGENTRTVSSGNFCVNKKGWYQTGQLKTEEYNKEVYYEEYFIKGIRKNYHRNGQLRELWHLKNRQHDSLHRIWSEDGKFKLEQIEIEDGKWVKTLWYENGQLKQAFPEMKSNEVIAVTPLAKDDPAEEVE